MSVDLSYPVSPGAITLGPGSQVPGDEPQLDYLRMPTGMNTWQPHFLPEGADARSHPALWNLLERLVDALHEVAGGAACRELDLTRLNEQELRLLAETLGEGEVSARARGLDDGRVEAQETALIGVWRVQCRDARGHLGSDRLFVGHFPALNRGWRAAKEASVAAPDAEAGLMNAAPVLTEIRDRAAGYAGEADRHVINFSLLPMTEADLALVGRHLGRGGMSILARGYGNCRMTTCALPNVWWVQYFNSTDQLILNTIEITDLPSVAQADREDLRDSHQRLCNMLDAYV